jgi:4-amino-4-deoxy-L-arabinose transferase-like glycosyltransferase
MKKLSLIFVCVLLAGAVLRAFDVRHTVDRPSWRECDVAGIARSYYREGLNLFYPRVDWRGDGPGYAEMEFPLYAGLIAASYTLFGFDERWGRVINFVFSLLTLVCFYRLAQYLLPPLGAVAAFTFFTFNPLLINIATSLQPEGLMVLAYVLAAYCFLRWLDSESKAHLIAAGAATALAILAKATAAHIGLFFALLLVGKYGVAAIKQARLWVFAVAALLPGAWWYWHAHKLWLQYGNSLGVSNEYHWAGGDLFTNPAFIVGILRSELFYVLMPAGLVIALLGVALKWRAQPVTYGLCWLVATMTYYLIAARTTGDQWAAYYHVVSLPGYALLVGSGVAGIWQRNSDATWNKLLRVAGGLSLIGILLFQARQIVVDARAWKPSPLVGCAQSFAALIPADDLILVTGGVCQEDGYPVAYNASFMLYWADRKGFNVCIEEQSLESAAAFAQRGAKYFIAAKSSFRYKKHLAEDLRQTYPVLAECEDYCLFQLKPHEVRD